MPDITITPLGAKWSRQLEALLTTLFALASNRDVATWSLPVVLHTMMAAGMH